MNFKEEYTDRVEKIEKILKSIFLKKRISEDDHGGHGV